MHSGNDDESNDVVYTEQQRQAEFIRHKEELMKRKRRRKKRTSSSIYTSSFYGEFFCISVQKPFTSSPTSTRTLHTLNRPSFTLQQNKKKVNVVESSSPFSNLNGSSSSMSWRNRKKSTKVIANSTVSCVGWQKKREIFSSFTIFKCHQFSLDWLDSLCRTLRLS